MEYVTARRAADMTGLNERTIRRHIASGKLSAERGDDGDYRIPVKALDALRKAAAARATRRGDLAGEVATLRAEVAELRATVEALQGRLDAADAEAKADRARRLAFLAPSRTHASDQPRASLVGDGDMPQPSDLALNRNLVRQPSYTPIRSASQSALGGDRVYLRAFAERHGVPGQTVMHHMRDNAFPVVSEPNPNRPEHRNHYLDGEGAQRAALTYWRTSWRGDDGHTLRECDNPTCSCHPLSAL